MNTFLGDQLLLPLALSSQTSQYHVASITKHLTTNALVIEQFKLAEIAIEAERQLVSVIPKGSS